MTKQILGEKNVTVGDQFPKGIDMMCRVPFDIVVNMSGAKIALPGAQTGRMAGGRSDRTEGRSVSRRGGTHRGPGDAPDHLHTLRHTR